MSTLDVLDTDSFRYGADQDDGGSNLVEVLRRASATIDSLWRAALREGTGEAALKLGEASHGLHRALIALAPSTHQ
ncbi:MAG TPA: hypothetical protein VFH58_14460 [Acidimicrobiales bacterium]|nr:hypothetical protein [Acidimicrobiales bacterium]